MSEEKMYAVKNGEGKYLLMDSTPCWDDKAGTTIKSDARALGWAKIYGGHVVTLIEEPEKVVLTKEQAQIVEKARDAGYPATYIFDHSYADEERLIINAYVNGYTVAKEKKYNVKVPHAEGWHFQKYSPESKRGLHNNWRPFPAKDVDSNMSKELFQFTLTEIEHYGLQDCEKEEVTDDDD